MKTKISSFFARFLPPEIQSSYIRDVAEMGMDRHSFQQPNIEGGNIILRESDHEKKKRKELFTG